MRVDESGRGEREQAQYPRGGGGQRGVHEAEDPGERAAVVALGAQLLGEVGDGRGGAGGEPASREAQGGGLTGALLDQSLGGERVDGDAYRAGEAVQQFERRLGVQAAQSAGADVRDTGQRSPGDRDDQTLGGVREQGVDLLGVGRVVEQQQGAAGGEGLAHRLAQVVGGGPGRRGQFQGRQQLPRGVLGGHGGAVGFGETGAQHPVRVTPRNLPYELLGERGAARTGPAGDEQHARAGALRPARVSRPARSMSTLSSFNSRVRPRN